MDNKEQHYILPSQLCVGLYVHLDLSWMHHPFALSSFKIKEQAQVTTIQGMGLSRVRYDPLRSDCQPLALDSSIAPPQPEKPVVIPEPEGSDDVRVIRARQLNQAINDCEKGFVKATGAARQISKHMESSPEEAAIEADILIKGMVDSLLTEGDVIIQAMDGSRLGDETYFHPLNVTVLSLMLAKSLDMTAEDSHCLGLAALFHDAGKSQVPDSVLMNPGPLTKAEQSLLQQHCQFGADLVRKAGLPERIAQIIMQHHECADGSGYPAGLRGDEIDPLARILSLVNAYDRLCNPNHHTEEAMTPYGALSYLFANERKKYDGPMLNLLIKSLGVYPPGSIVLLNDGIYGVVVSVNPQKLLRPFILLHDRRADRNSPNILDLGEETDTSISKCLRAEQLPKDVAEYLQCRQRLSYFFTTADITGGSRDLISV